LIAVIIGRLTIHQWIGAPSRPALRGFHWNKGRSVLPALITLAIVTALKSRRRPMRHTVRPELQPPAPATARRLQRLRRQFRRASTPWNKPGHTWRRLSLGRGDRWSGEGSAYRAWLDSKPRHSVSSTDRGVRAGDMGALLAGVTSIAAFLP
jgi:hypothetical protein